jgi:SnoaL-like domain
MRDLETLNAIEDIRQLEARYARYADEKRWADLAGLFTADAVFRPLDVAGNEVARMNGRADIAAQLGSRNSGDVQPIHLLLTHEIEIESATAATGVWAMSDLIFRGDSAIPEPQPGAALPPFRTMRGWGHYHVTYRKEDGQWLIAARTQTRTRLEFTY